MGYAREIGFTGRNEMDNCHMPFPITSMLPAVEAGAKYFVVGIQVRFEVLVGHPVSVMGLLFAKRKNVGLNNGING